MQWMGQWLNAFWQTNCPLCGRSTGAELCASCERRLRQGQFHPAPTWQPIADLPVPLFAWGAYQGTLKQIIKVLKYDNHPELAQPLGTWLAEAVLAQSQGPVSLARRPQADHSLTGSPRHPSSVPSLIQSLRPTVVPIPMHASKQQQRGFNQAERISQAFCERSRLPLQAHGLRRHRATEAQFSLSAQQREQNLATAFTVGDAFQRRPPRAVLLLDDIYTTGATMRSALHTFQQAHIPVLGVVVVARTVSQRGVSTTGTES